MRVRLIPTVLAAGVLALTAGCAEVGNAVGELRGSAEQLSNDARFCLAVARAVTSIESGTSSAALDAAEEALAHAPDRVQADARIVTQRLRDGVGVEDPQLSAAIDGLRRSTHDLCVGGS